MNRTLVQTLFAGACMAVACVAEAAPWPGHARGMGIGGWLTNYKRFNVLPEDKRLAITAGDLAHFDSYITEGDVARIKAWGFDHIRLGFDQIVLEEAPGRWRDRTFAKVTDFLGWCAKHKIAAVLNLHKAVGNYCDIPEKVQLLDDPALQERFIALWLEMERRCAAYPDAAFELLNEVRNVDPEKWNRLADRTIKALRAVNPNRWIVVGSTCWNSPSKLAVLKVWDDPHVAYTYHMYDPHMFTHQRGVLQAGPLAANEDVPYPGRARVEAALAPAEAWSKAHPDKILWNGEFGTIRHMSPPSRVAYMRDIVRFCRRAGMPWCVWNYLSTPNDGNRFSLVDDVTRDFLSDALQRACLGEGDAAARGELTYMAFNIWGAYFGNPVWERDLKEADLILRAEPDLVGLQEVMPAFWSSRLFPRLARDYGIVRSGTDPKAEYNPLLWRKDRLDCLEQGTHVFAAADNPERTKGFGWGVFRDKATGRTLIAYSTHLWYQSGRKDPANDAMRVRNVREILARMDALRAKYPGAPVVGGGDLNCTRNDWEAGRTSPLATFHEAGFHDAQYTVKDAAPCSSHHGDPQRDALGNYRGWIRAGAEDPKNSLDHVHYSAGITPCAFAVDRSQAALETSDHSPVLFTFKVD